MKHYNWIVTTLSRLPDDDGRVGLNAFLGNYQLNGASLDQMVGWLRGLPMADAVYIGITRADAS